MFLIIFTYCAQQLSEEEKARQRELLANAAINRKGDFKVGGGGEKYKAKQKAIERERKKNEERFGDGLNNPNQPKPLDQNWN